MEATIFILFLLATLSCGEEIGCFVDGKCEDSYSVSYSWDVVVAEDCLEQCNDWTFCKYFTYDRRDNFCYGFSDCVSLNSSACADCTSGQSDCAGNSCYTPGQCANAELIWGFPTDSISQCLRECKSLRRRQCVSYTFDIKARTCLLFASCPAITKFEIRDNSQFTGNVTACNSTYYKEVDHELFQTTAKGDTAKVKVALHQGANVDHKEESEMKPWGTFQSVTPLMIAAFEGHQDTVLLLLQQGANIDWIKTPTYLHDQPARTALMWAASNGHTDICRLLHDHGADLEAKNDFRIRAMHLAAQNGHLDVVKMLIARGAHVNPKSLDQKTPLDLAEEEGREVVAKFLRMKGGINQGQTQAQTSLYFLLLPLFVYVAQ